MKITVFTPTYNRGYCLERLFRSLLNQTFTDFEWLIIDDGSIDNTEELVKDFQESCKDFPIIYKKTENGGKHRAINRGMSLVNGEIILFMDSDDWLRNDALVIDEMSIGGIPKACVDFANQLKDHCNVVLLMKRDDGAMMSGLSKEITVKLMQTPGFKPTIKKLKKERNYIKLIRYILKYIVLTKFSNRWVKANELTAKTYGIYEDDAYDCVITYHGMSISQLLTSLYGVKAAKKIAWIHGDHPFEGIHKRDVNSIYGKFDKIFCVSPSVCVRFLNDFPNLTNTVESYKNLLLPQRIRKLSEEKITEKFDSKVVNIATVGRVSKEKGQEMIPHANFVFLSSS